MSRVPHVLVHHKGDNVAVVVVEGVKAKERLFGVCLDDNSEFEVTCNHDIPIGHKVALTPMTSGDDAIKYGQVIGRIVAEVAVGDHVHTHNLKTKRW
ncbi:MAG: UxaA family hydrolase [Alphaproteobacteria bacterium]|jgi:(2R)-sulfolactate sulfo-lyase subunit alpha|nr:UxaA family hydrolase [Alphaproteobacteria bacterium]